MDKQTPTVTLVVVGTALVISGVFMAGLRPRVAVNVEKPFSRAATGYTETKTASLTVTSPAAGQNIQLGSTPQITWKWSGDRPLLNYAILKKDGITIDDAFFGYPQESDDTKTGTAWWKETAYIKSGEWDYVPKPGAGYSLWVCSPKSWYTYPFPGQESECNVWSESGKFNIVSVPYVFLNFPNGNNQLSRRANLTVKWQGNQVVRIVFSLYRRSFYGTDVFVKQLAGVQQSNFDQKYTLGTPFSGIRDSDLGKYLYKIRVSGYTADNKLVYDQSAIPFAVVQ